MMQWLAMMMMMIQWLVLAPHSRNVLGSGPGSHCVESVLLVFVWVFLQVFLPQFPSTVQGRADLADWSVCVSSLDSWAFNRSRLQLKQNKQPVFIILLYLFLQISPDTLRATELWWINPRNVEMRSHL